MNRTTKDDVIAAVKGNHIWLNAFSCINPTDEFLLGVGRDVVDMLRQKENLKPMYMGDGECSEDMLKLAEITPVLYLSINKS